MSQTDERSSLLGRTLPAVRLPASFSERLVLYASALAVGYLALTPLLFLLWTSLWSGHLGTFEGQLTLENYIATYSDPATYTVIWNAVIVSVGTVLGAMGLGFVFAWFIVKTDVRWKGKLETLLLTPFAIPPFLYVLMYIYTYGPEIGFTTGVLQELGVATQPVNLFSVWGIVIVTSITLAPTAYTLLTPTIQNLDASFEEAAYVHGASPAATLYEVSLPLIRPALSSTVLVLFIRGFGAFAVPLLLGLSIRYFVVSTKIWQVTQGQVPAEYGFASALAAVVVLVSGLFIWIHRRLTAHHDMFMTVRGETGTANQLRLRRWRLPASVLLATSAVVIWLLPIVVMAIISLHGIWRGVVRLDRLTLVNYTALVEPELFHALGNTVVVSVVGAALGTVLVTLFAYYTERTEYRFRNLLDFLSLTPMASTSIILGLSISFTYLWLGNLTPISLYGTRAILIIGLITLMMPVAIKIATGSIVQIHDELEHAAYIFGANWLQQMYEVFLPLYKNSMGRVFFYLFIHMFRHIPVVVMLYIASTETIPIVIFNAWVNGANLEKTAALSTLLIGVLIISLSVARHFDCGFYGTRLSNVR